MQLGGSSAEALAYYPRPLLPLYRCPLLPLLPHVRWPMNPSRYFFIAVLAMLTLSAQSEAEVLLDKPDGSGPEVRLDLDRPQSKGINAILAMYALQAGGGCDGRTDEGIQCMITNALGIGPQCSSQHIALVRSWFRQGIPQMSGYAADLYKNTQQQSALENICYSTPNTATSGRFWSTIHLTQRNQNVIVDARGVWFVGERGGDFGYRTTYRIRSDSIDVIKHVELKAPGNKINRGHKLSK